MNFYIKYLQLQASSCTLGVMNVVEKFHGEMAPGRVYRRQDLRRLSSAVDRNLKTLVCSGRVRKLGAGLYCRPRRNAFGAAPPEDRDLVRAFLKTDDFLLTSRNAYSQLGLGLTQLYGGYVVYNHKRLGEFVLGGKRFEFRRVPEYPRRLSREYLLVDLLNNLRHLPDDTGPVLRNLPSRLGGFDRDPLRACLERYGSAAARRFLGPALA